MFKFNVILKFAYRFRQLLPHRRVRHRWNRIMRSKSGSKLESKRGQTSGCLLTVQVSFQSEETFQRFRRNRTTEGRKFRFLNSRDSESGEVRVYPGKLQVSESFCIVPVTEATTIADLIEEALQKFGLQNFKSEDYRCSEILLDHGGKFLFNSPRN